MPETSRHTVETAQTPCAKQPDARVSRIRRWATLPPPEGGNQSLGGQRARRSIPRRGTEARFRQHGVVAGVERARADHDAGAGAVLRRAEPRQGRTEHDDDELLVYRAHLRSLAPLWLQPVIWPQLPPWYPPLPRPPPPASPPADGSLPG